MSRYGQFENKSKMNSMDTFMVILLLVFFVVVEIKSKTILPFIVICKKNSGLFVFYFPTKNVFYSNHDQGHARASQSISKKVLVYQQKRAAC